jgi:hypothetical protein
MLTITHSHIVPAGFHNMWECYAYASDGKFYSDLGWPTMAGNGKHHVILHGRNAKSAKRKLDRLIRKVERKYNY